MKIKKKNNLSLRIKKDKNKNSFENESQKGHSGEFFRYIKISNKKISRCMQKYKDAVGTIEQSFSLQLLHILGRNRSKNKETTSKFSNPSFKRIISRPLRFFPFSGCQLWCNSLWKPQDKIFVRFGFNIGFDVL